MQNKLWDSKVCRIIHIFNVLPFNIMMHVKALCFKIENIKQYQYHVAALMCWKINFLTLQYVSATMSSDLMICRLKNV